MIVFINGPFGVGKTTVARLLVRRMPHATLYDPDQLGVVLRRVLGPFAEVAEKILESLPATPGWSRS